MLPVHTSVSNLAVSDVVITLVAYSAFYTGMFIIGFYLMKKFAKKGPIPPADKQPDTEFDLIDLDEQGAKA